MFNPIDRKGMFPSAPTVTRKRKTLRRVVLTAGTLDLMDEIKGMAKRRSLEPAAWAKPDAVDKFATAVLELLNAIQPKER